MKAKPLPFQNRELALEETLSTLSRVKSVYGIEM